MVRLGLLLAAGSGAACVLELPDIDAADRHRCETDMHCVTGYVCGAAGFCVQAGRGDTVRAPGDTNTGDTVGGDVNRGDTLTGDSRNGDLPAGDRITGDPRAGDNSSGDPPRGDASSGDTSVGDSTGGDLLNGDVNLSPPGLSVVSVDDSTVCLEWTGSHPTYDVYSSANGSVWMVVWTAVGGNQRCVGSLTNGVRTFFRVVGSMGGGPSNHVNAVPEPRYLYVTRRTDTQIASYFLRGDTTGAPENAASTGGCAPQDVAADVSRSELFVTCESTNSVRILSSSNLAQQREFTDPAGPGVPQGIAYDPTHDEVVVGWTSHRVSTYPRDASGATAALRSIAGAATNLNAAWYYLAVDPFNEEILVANDDTVTVYDRLDDGNVAPKRESIAIDIGSAAVQGIAVDPLDNRIFIALGQPQDSVYSIDRLHTGAVPVSPPTLQGATTLLSPTDIELNPWEQQLVVLNPAMTGASVTTYGWGDVGDTAPAATISGAATVLDDSMFGLALGVQDPSVLVSGHPGIVDIETGGGFVYFLDATGVFRVPASGGPPTQLAPATGGLDLEVAGDWAYWSSPMAVERVHVRDLTVQSYDAAMQTFDTIAVHATRVFGQESGTINIYWANIAAGSSFIPYQAETNIRGMWLDGDTLYYAQGPFSTSRIRMVDVTGGGQPFDWVTNLTDPSEVVVTPLGTFFAEGGNLCEPSTGMAGCAIIHPGTAPARLSADSTGLAFADDQRVLGYTGTLTRSLGDNQSAVSSTAVDATYYYWADATAGVILRKPR